jgi:predicted glycosyltransferase
MSARTLRVVLHSQDIMGMGRMRRNLLVAQALTAVPVRLLHLVFELASGPAASRPIETVGTP